VGFSITGDIARLVEWQRKVAEAKSVALSRLTKNVGETLISLVRDGFEGEHDPYGGAWAPLKVREGAILQDTGALRNGWHRSGNSNSSVTIAPSVDYADYHQDGTSKMVARPMVPNDGDLPPKWSEEIKATAQDVLDDYFKG